MTALTLEQLNGFIAYVNGSFPLRPFSRSPLGEFTAGRVLMTTGSGREVQPVDLGTIGGGGSGARAWIPETEYKTAYTDTSGTSHANEIVSHDGSLYVVMLDFTSGLTFADVIGGLVVLSRLTMDTDLQYIELPFSAVGPFISNQTIGMYSPITNSVTVSELWSLPNTLAPHIQNQQYSKFYCNPDISTNAVVTLYSLSNVGETELGTITFNPLNAQTSYVIGIMDLGITGSFTLNVGDILIARITTVPINLSWVSLNTLGSMRSVRSPEFNIPV